MYLPNWQMCGHNFLDSGRFLFASQTFMKPYFNSWLLSLSVLTIFLIETYWRIFHVESSKVQHNIGHPLVTYKKIQVWLISEKFSHTRNDCFITDGTKHFRGAEVTIFKAIAEHLKFQYVITEPEICCGFGSISTGLRGEMTMGLSDIGWSQLYFTQWRWQHHDITSSYDEDQACLIVNNIFLLTCWVV